ncbi:MAG: TldD/PmbA family protein [Woeseia sp.]
MTVRRRDFLGHLAAGSAVVSMPAFLQGCGSLFVNDPAGKPPANPFLEWFGIDDAMASRVLSALAKNGADAAELYFQYRQSSDLVMEEGVITHSATDVIQGVGLRVVMGGQMGFAFTDDLALPGMLAAASRAATIAGGSEQIAPQAFAPSPAGNLYRTEVSWADVQLDRKLPLLQRAERAARAADPAVARVTVNWHDSDERVLIMTLDGRMITDARPMTRLSVQPVAKRGTAAYSGFASIAAREGIGWYTDQRIDRVAQTAVDRTLLLFDARRPPSGDMPVILAAGAGGILLHEAIGHAFEADFSRDGVSPYGGATGQKVAEPIITIVDDATIPGARGALNYDDEGTAGSRTVVVENGILRTCLHDAMTAQHYGTGTTGSARRESYRFAPMPRMTCTYIEDGPHERDEVIAAVSRGIIAETFTDVRVSPGGGDFMLHVRNGWMVENGKVTAPIRDVDISGNGPETLRRMTMAANDSALDRGGWMCGKKGQQVPVSQGMPTVLVSGMMVNVRG